MLVIPNRSIPEAIPGKSLYAEDETKKEKGLRSQLHFVAARHLSICSTLHICDLLSLIFLVFFLPFFFSESHFFRDSFRSSIQDPFSCQVLRFSLTLYSIVNALRLELFTSVPVLPHLLCLRCAMPARVMPSDSQDLQRPRLSLLSQGSRRRLFVLLVRL